MNKINPCRLIDWVRSCSRLFCWRTLRNLYSRKKGEPQGSNFHAVSSKSKIMVPSHGQDSSRKISFSIYRPLRSQVVLHDEPMYMCSCDSLTLFRFCWRVPNTQTLILLNLILVFFGGGRNSAPWRSSDMISWEEKKYKSPGWTFQNLLGTSNQLKS